MSSYAVITNDQEEQFLRDGYCVVTNCFSREVAQEWTDRAFARLGYDRDDPTSWEEEIAILTETMNVKVKDFSPKAWGAICDVIGGEERQGGLYGDEWADCFLINFKNGADGAWIPPSPVAKGWHKDGNYFRHFLDSPEQGLLTIVCWSDILPQSGGTFLACDSVKHISSYLRDHPHGMLNSENMDHLIELCTDFREATGKVGDVYLIHPFMLHATSQNPSGRPRIITNPPVALKEPMKFSRDDPDEYSLVERKILRDLGVSRLAYRPAAPREQFV